jgi:hypothetical protein
MTDPGLADWLARQYDADEKTATGLQSMVASLSELNDRMPPDTRRGTQVYDAGAWALDRMLAEIAAKRRRLDLHRPDPEWSNRCKICLSDRAGRHSEDWSADAWPCETILIDAAPYAGREGWRGEWAVA